MPSSLFPLARLWKCFFTQLWGLWVPFFFFFFFLMKINWTINTTLGSLKFEDYRNSGVLCSNLKVCKLAKVCLGNASQGGKFLNRSVIGKCSSQCVAGAWRLHAVRLMSSKFGCVLEVLMLTVIFLLFLHLISEWLKSGVFPLPSVLQSHQYLPWFKKHQEKPWQVLQWWMLISKENIEIFAGPGICLGFAS